VDKVRITTRGHPGTPGWVYLVAVLVLTWLLWIPAALLPRAEPDPLVLALHYLGGSMPLLVALAFILFREPAAYRKDYWRRLVGLRRLGPTWAAAALLIAPLLTMAAAGIDRAAGGQGIAPEAIQHFVGRPLALLPFSLSILVFGPLPEELGWRGYALDRLQLRTSALTASLVLGAVWTLWHLPLFWIEGSWQHGLGVGTMPFWLYMLDKVPQSVVMTWLVNNARRSTLPAIAVHFTVNFVGELTQLTPYADVLLIVLWWGLATIITVIWGPATLSRRPRPNRIGP
jgi:membrane protease YdiL (CAAX protease family)